MAKSTGNLAVAPGALTEIGYELANSSAADAFDLLVAAELGKTNVPNYLRPLLNLIQDGKINPSFVTHLLALNDAAPGNAPS